MKEGKKLHVLYASDISSFNNISAGNKWPSEGLKKRISFIQGDLKLSVQTFSVGVYFLKKVARF